MHPHTQAHTPTATATPTPTHSDTHTHTHTHTNTHVHAMFRPRIKTHAETQTHCTHHGPHNYTFGAVDLATITTNYTLVCVVGRTIIHDVPQVVYGDSSESGHTQPHTHTHTHTHAHAHTHIRARTLAKTIPQAYYPTDTTHNSDTLHTCLCGRPGGHTRRAPGCVW